MIKAILLDIEGTTTPIDFVHKTLFPFASQRIDQYVRENIDDLQSEITELSSEHTADAGYTTDFDRTPISVAAYLKYLIDHDRKSTPLKSIQGKLWKKGYENGELCSAVFDDVLPAFKRWKAAGRTIAIYSSGSILAQKLLFKYTTSGDLTPLLDSYFDTNIGPKRESASYARIASTLEIEPKNILFVSDIAAELDAAATNGIRTILSVRPGNGPTDDSCRHHYVENFDSIN